MHVHNTVNVYMLTYCFTYVVLKLYAHHDNNVRLFIIVTLNNDFYQIQPGKRSYMAPTLVTKYNTVASSLAIFTLSCSQ